MRGRAEHAHCDRRPSRAFGEVFGLPQPWETLCSTRESDEAYDNDPAVLDYIAITKKMASSR